jgi:hypothetical protein
MEMVEKFTIWVSVGEIGPAAVWDYGMMPKSFEQMAS